MKREARLSQRQADRLVALHGRESSLVIELQDGAAPLWRYWGPKLAEDFVSGPVLLETRPTPSFSLDETVAFSVFPTFGLGWFGQSALLAHRNGQDFAHAFTRCEINKSENRISLRLNDDVAQIVVEQIFAMDIMNDVLTISASLTNNGTEDLQVAWLAAACISLPDHAEFVQSYSGRHNNEFVEQKDHLGRAIWRKENRRGLTSHDAFPGALVVTGEMTFGAQLAWSGNHVQSIEWLDDGRYQWQLGEWLAPGEVQLAPGETLTSPDVLATCARNAGGVARNFHTAIRKLVTWPDGRMSPRPVHLNTWEGYYFDHDMTALTKLADAAAEVGVERFILDDGWFHKRNDDSSSLGDWWTDAAKYPDGLKPLAEHVVAKDMQFGLWIEPEMVNPDSELYRAHPEWALHISGRPIQTARNQLVLDLTRPEVGDYLFETIMKVIADLPVSYLKWDHNRDLIGVADKDGRAAYHRQIHAAYALFDRFRAALPHVEIEACAGGGGRIDAGIVQRTHRFWTSDCIDAVMRVGAQRGFLQFMPPELMGSHIGTAPAHSTGRSQALDFRAAVALQGHFGLEFDLVKTGAAERARIASWVAFYKQWRHLLHAQVWQGDAGDLICWHAAGSADEWLLIVYHMQPSTFRHMPPVRLPFVVRDVHYRIAQIWPDAPDEVATYDGRWLAQAGMPIPPMNAESAVIYHGKRI
jgi:alpha-galactosidase